MNHHARIRSFLRLATRILTLLALGFLSIPAASAAPPDLTAPGVIATIDRSETYNLGPTGLRGWIHITRTDGLTHGSNGTMTGESRQILVTVASAPADTVLAVDDVILGAMAANTGDVPLFSSDARKAFATAISEAEKTGGGTLRVKRWRADETTDVNIPIAIMGDYTATAPYSCPKSALIRANARNKLVADLKADANFLTGSWDGAIKALALLASVQPGDPDYATVQTRLQTHARNLASAGPQPSSLPIWTWAYNGLFLAEYYLLTSDANVLPGIQSYTLKLVESQSIYGTYGHGPAFPRTDGSGRRVATGYGPVNAAGIVANMAIFMGKKALVAGSQAVDPEINTAIQRGSDYFKFYVNKGSIPYGEHEPGTNGHTSNGKDPMCAVFFGLQSGRATETEYYARMSIASHNGREYGHTGQGFSYLWGALGANMGGSLAVAEYLKPVRWHLDLSRRTDGSFAYDGAEQYGAGSTSDGTYLGASGYYGLNTTASYLLTYSLPLQRLYITGKRDTPANPAPLNLDASTVAHAIAAGNFKIDCPTFTTATLISSLSNYDPIVRHYAAIELGNRSATITPAELATLRAMLTGTDANARMGAAQALGLLQDSTALPTIVTLLNDPDIWVRAKAAVAIRAYPSATASAHRDPMMTSFIANATNPDVIDWNDPLQMGNGKLSMAVFGHGVGDGTPGNDIAAYTINAPKESLLYPALRAGLQQPDSYVRTGATQFAKNRLSLTDTQAIYPSVAHAAAYDTPADRMWSNASRADAISLLANLKISGGIDLALSMLENPFDFQWGSQTSTIAALNGLASYGDAARYTLPTLKGYLTQWNPSSGEYPVLVSTIETIENAITAPAQPPGLCVANSQVVTTTGSAAITLTGSSPRGSFTYLNVTQPAHGTLTGTAPNLTYTPTGGYTGPDSFTFQTTDTLTTSTVATVGIIVGTAGNGLKGEYFDNANFTNLKLTRTDAQVNFDWGTGTPDASIGADTFSVRWSGVLLVPQTGNYTFSALTSDGVRLYINGQLVIDRFVDQSTRWTDSTPVYLTAGQHAEVYMEYHENTGSAVAKLKWTGPGFAGANGNFIPQAYLFDGSGISNRPAYAFPQSLSTNQNTALPILLNGSGGTLSYTVLTQPTNGTLSGTAPHLTYTPNSNFSGTDSFTFLVHNGTANSLPATVSINVQAGALTSFTWANAVSGNWNDGTKWTPSAPAATGQPYYALNFTTAGTYTATHNLNNGFQLNQLNANANVTLAGTQGVAFAANGGALPQLNQNGANEVRVDHPMSLQAMTTLGGSGGGKVILNGVISGAGGLIKNSPGDLEIGQNNSYSGGTTINAGTLTMTAWKDSALGSGPITLNGGTLLALCINAANPITVNGGKLSGDGGWGGSWSGPVTLNGNLTVFTHYYDRISLNGNITGTGGLIAEGDTVPYNSGNGVFLAGTNTYTGKTAVTSGMWLHCSSPAALGSGAVEISSGAKLDLIFTGTRPIASLTLDGVTKTPGTYGSTASNATNKNDTYFSGTGTVTVLQPTTTSLNLTTGGSPAQSGSSLTFTATVTGSSPTGNVEFFSGNTLLGTSALNGSFQATFTTNQLAIGSHSITARYVGNSTNGSSNSAAIVVEITPAAPAAPTGLNATPGATNSTNISLSWTASAGATGYYVKRSTTSGGPYSILAYVTGTTCQDTTVTPGVSYYYVISALNAAGESADSNQATALVTYVGVVTDTNPVIVPEGGTNTFKVKLSSAPAADVVVTIARSAGDADISVQSGGALTFTNGNWSTWQTITLAAANDADALDGTATITCTPDNPSYATKTVTAIEDDTNSHTVTYYGNGSSSGTPPVDASSPYPQGSTVTVLGNTGNLTKSGHSLAGWNTSSNGSGTTYAPGATFTMPGANVSLYPVWNHLPTADAGPDITTNVNGPSPTYGWSYAPWTGDADSGISNAFPYTAAHSFGGNNGGSVAVNGVTFTENFNTSGTGWSIDGNKADWTGNDDAAVTGNSEKLAQEFIYGGNPRTVTFTGLTPGVTYEATFFSVAWESGNRNQTFSATGGDSAFINQSAYNDNNGIRISCIYIATATSQQFTITPENGSTFHLYAMSNKDITQTFAATVNLDGSVGDFENDPLTTTWSQISGPAPAIITNPSAVDTTATFPQPGTYILQLTADDGSGSATDTVTITVNPPIVHGTPPTPNPMTWASVPAATSSSSITMTATTASAPSGVEYYFDETSGNPGGTDSGWQDSPTYIDTGLSPSTSYTYTVKARDKSAEQNETGSSSAASATTNPPPVPTVVWNVNIGNEITISDNFAGAASENTPNSFWNSATTGTITASASYNLALKDSTNSATSATLALTAPAGNDVGYADWAVVTGVELFSSWIKTNGNSTPFTMTIGGLTSGATYDLIVYSDWTWKDNDWFPVTQTLGSGLTGTVYLDQISSGSNGAVPNLVQDTDPAQNGAVEGNWIRITGLSPDASGNLAFSMGGRNSAFNGFQLIQMGNTTPDNTPPTPNPMTWASVPAATSSDSITMTATTASDPSDVEYYFDETSGNSGGTDSGWQSSPTYTDTGLSPSTSYTYTVKARDKSAAENETGSSSAASATTNPPPSGSIVWNVNIGDQIATSDNYAGAVTQANPIQWNSITASSASALALKDSSGSTAGGITLDLTSNRNPGGASLTSGDKIFLGWFGGAGAQSTITLRGLTIAKTYDILFYSDWYWKNGDSLPITQTAGTGLSGTFYLNRILSGADGTVPALTPDTNPANVTSGTGNTGNYCRIVGIVPDTEGKVSFRIGDGANSAFCGFQLVQTGDIAPRADILEFSLASNPPSIRNAVISDTDITLTVPYGTDVTNLAPAFTLWPGATCVPVSGTARNFTTPQTYTVTSSDSLVTKNYLVTVVAAPPLPEFTLTAPATWDGRSTITAQPAISNLALLQANNGTNFTYTWSTSGLAVTHTTTPGVMSLTRSQGSGALAITLTLNNGTENVTRSTTINVTEPATDPWLERTPGTTEKAVNGQFIARNPFTNNGIIHYNGTQSGTPNSVYLKIFQTPSGGSEALLARHEQALVNGTYTFAAPVPAGLFTYRVVYGTKTGTTDTDIATVTDLVCGDAYIIEGQSNALAIDNGEPQVDTSSPWIYTYTIAQGWVPAIAKPTSPNWDRKIGFWGMKMAQEIVASHQMPVCIINGAEGGTRIDQHQPNPANRTVGAGTHDIYANLLNRVIAAKLTHGIRGIFWHQGESDSSNFGPPLDPDHLFYEQNFLTMSSAWKQDFPNIQRYILFQVAPNPCSMGPFASEIREVQRRLPRLFSKMSIVGTIAIPGYEGCHYSKADYENLAALVLPVVNRDFYDISSSSAVTSPNLVRVWFTNEARTSISLKFDQPMSWSSFSLPNWHLNDVSGQVISGSASGDTITLQLASAASANSTLDYVKDTWSFSESFSTLIYGVNGIPALTFADVPVTPPTPYEAWTGSAFANPLTDHTPGGDPDGDGLTNLQEFAFGTQPTAGLGGPLEFVSGAEVTKTGSPVLRGYTPPQGKPPYQAVFGRRKNHAAAGLSYTAEFSANLSYWTPSGAGLSVLTGAGSHEIEVVAVPFPETVPLSLGGTDTPPKFFRIRVATTP